MLEYDDHAAAVLEPNLVSGWLGLPGTQLPRETTKIIGQPTQPAKKKGGSARYSIMDAVLMKLGRRLAEFGVSPHRVRVCMKAVKKSYIKVLTGRMSNRPLPQPIEDIGGPFFLFASESSEGFQATVQLQESLPPFWTEKNFLIITLLQETRTMYQNENLRH